MTLMSKTKITTAVAAVLALVGAASIAQAAVSNGNFATVTGGSPAAAVSTPQNNPGNAVNVTDWSNGAGDASGYVFIYSSANPTASTNGVSFYGVTAAPHGSTFLAVDPVYLNPGEIHQLVGGLTIGATYTLTFDWAAAQQVGYDGPTTEFWTVDLGSSPSQSTAVYNLPNHGFSGWMGASFDFVANSTSEVLSFLAGGGPNAGVPPFDLLANVALTQKIPEPASIAMFGAGLVGFAGFAAMRRRKNKKS